MKILITNDDGIDADGLAALCKVAGDFGELTVVAPKQHYSGCSHQMTFEGNLDAHHIGNNRHWVDGFPADCVRIALAHICPEVDLVISGINHGANLGLDNFLSGTVAAAREATFFNIPSIALSQYNRGLSAEVWSKASVMARRSIEHVISGRLRAGHYWNVNFPCLDNDQNADPESIEFVECPLDRTPLPNDYVMNELGYTYDGDYHGRDYKPGTDVAICMQGNISLTLIGTGSAAFEKSGTVVGC